MEISKIIITLIFYSILSESACESQKSSQKVIIKPKGRIINGEIETMDKRKYLVSIRSIIPGISGMNICGGSLISLKVVLTAAHCFANAKGVFFADFNYYVVLGSLSISKRHPSSLTYGVKKIIYSIAILNRKTYENDIALLILNGSVPNNHPNVKPIPINTVSKSSGTMCTVSGWGITENGTPSDLLRSSNVPFLSRDICSQFSSYRQGTIKEGMICAGDIVNGNSGACKVDSGGPLVCEGLLTGIVSFGPQVCGTPGQPAVFTEVSHWAPWIAKVLHAESLQLPKLL